MTNAPSRSRATASTTSDVADVSPARLAQFFVTEGDGYRIRKDLRELVLFAPHDLLKDPPFAHLDLVSCRNLLIYLDRPAQLRTAEILHFALRPGAYLFLGTSESVDGAGDLFASIDRDAHIFRTRAVGARVALPLPDSLALKPVNYWPDDAVRRPPESRARERASFADLHQRLLEEYAPPSVVVNEAYDIVHLTERAGRFLQFTAGEPSRNLLKTIRPELRLDMRTALYQAAQECIPVQSGALPLRIEDRTMTVRLMVRPVLREEDPARGFFLVLFEELREAVTAGDDHVVAAALTADDAARRLEGELARVNNQLRVSIEQYETQTEELKASNQELQAANEELRSSAEELETSREELQSTNEELQTVNQELKNKLDELSQAHNDIQNLINSSDIGTLFLDRSLRIQLYTPTVCRIFSVIPSDRGRALSDIRSNLVETDLRSDVARVLDRLERVEREVRTQDERWWLMHAVPYRTRDDRIDGVIMTFVDITDRKLAEERLRQSQFQLRLLIESALDYAIFSTDLEGRIDVWNTGAAQVFGYADAEAVGRSAAMLFTSEDRERGVPADLMGHAREHGRATDERWHVRKDGSLFFGSGILTPLRTENGVVTGFVTITRDLTGRKQSEDALRHAYDDLDRLVADRTRDLEAANGALAIELQQWRATEERAKRLLARMISIQEDERRRIARDLHDHLGQQMTALRLRVDSAVSSIDVGSEAARRVRDAQALITHLDEQLDFLTWELRPSVLDDLGLVAALRTFVREWSTTYGVAAEFQSTCVDHERFGLEVETNLYRIAQEALNNVYKHADATHVKVVLERRHDEIVFVVEDDGKGFTDLEAKHAGGGRESGFGVVGMQERAALLGGRLEIRTAPGKGTTLFVRLPVSPTIEQQA